MYVSSNIFDKECEFIDIDDRTFFELALEQAMTMMPEVGALGLDTAELKEMAPICHVSTFTPPPTEAERVVTRRAVHDPKRARRKSIVCDVDFNPGEEREADSLRKRLLDFSREYATPVMIYPTLSYPSKPRFRFVLLTARQMHADSYARAISWIYGQLGFGVTDTSDYRMNTNRNLPFFDCREQVDGVFSNFGDSDLSPLDNGLWRDEPLPVSVTKAAFADRASIDVDLHAKPVDAGRLRIFADKVAESQMARGYDTFWPVMQSLACSVGAGGVSEETALKICEQFATAAPDKLTQQRWAAGNVDDLYRRLRALTQSDYEKSRPLNAWISIFVDKEPHQRDAKYR